MTIKGLPKALILGINSDRDMLRQRKKLGSFLAQALLRGINQCRVRAALGQYLIPQIYPAPYSLNNDEPEQQGVIFISYLHLY